jgi:tetratricopeptide (TPR) repeat protein
VEKADFIKIRLQQRHDERLRAFDQGKIKQRPRLDFSEAQEFNRKAVTLYEWFIRDFPRDPKMDQALYFLGYNYFALGEFQKGAQHYQRLVREYPRSPFVVESQFALAEFHFERDEWRQALGRYKEIMKLRRHRLREFSAYKAAWCHYRLGESREGIRLLEAVIVESRRASGDERVQRIRLENDALRDLVIFYASGGDPERAVAYFSRLAGDKAAEYLERLGFIYIDRGQISGAKQVFDHFISLDPNNPKAFEYRYQIVRALVHSPNVNLFKTELLTWIRDYGHDSPWARANQADRTLMERAEKLREETLRTWTLQQHQTAQNSKAAFSQNLAFEGYTLYFRQFEKSPRAADMRFYFGELLYDMKRFDEASVQYRWVVENAPQSQFHALAAENAILSLERILPSDSEINRRVGERKTRVEFQEQEQRFASGVAWYLSRLPRGDKAPELKFRLARLHYQFNQFAEARPLFKDIIQNHSGTQFAEMSANLLLDSYTLEGDTAGLNAAAAELLKNPQIARSKLGSEIRDILSRTDVQKAQDLERAGDFARAAQTYFEFSQGTQNSSLKAPALFNAAVNYEKAGDFKGAVAAHQALLALRNPESQELRKKSRRAYAKILQDSGKLIEAAREYQLAAQEAGNEGLARDLHYNAAIIYQLLGENASATRSFENYLQGNRSRERFEAFYQMGQLAREQKQLTRAIDLFTEFLNSGTGEPAQQINASFQIYEMSRALGRVTATQDWKNRTLRIHRSVNPGLKGMGAKEASQIKLHDLQELVSEFERIQLKNLRTLKQDIDRKISLITRITKELGEVIALDAPAEIIQSLYILGKVNQSMGRSMIDSPVPPEITDPAKIEEYRKGVQGLADPFLTKARESFVSAVDRSREFEVYPQAYFDSLSQLRILGETKFYQGGERPLAHRELIWRAL